MKITQANDTVTKVTSVAGLIEIVATSKVTQTEATADYIGPKIPRSVWHQVLAFFKWTYDRDKSESQVRLYVNPQLGTWVAWAFPQEMGTGMTAREVDTPAAAEQRQMFRQSDGWMLYGTVHHHCSASAFQSGTDEANEKSQDGLHITVGYMDKPHYDISVRFYSGKNKFDPDMSKFWDVGAEAVADATAMAGRYGMKLDLNAVAKHQMGEPPASAEFPQQWRDNLVKMPAAVQRHQAEWSPGLVNGSHRKSYGPSSGGKGLVQDDEWPGSHFKKGKKHGLIQKRAAEVLDELEAHAHLIGDGTDALYDLLETQLVSEIVDVCREYDVSASDLSDELTRQHLAKDKKLALPEIPVGDEQLPDQFPDYPGYGHHWGH